MLFVYLQLIAPSVIQQRLCKENKKPSFVFKILAYNTLAFGLLPKPCPREAAGACTLNELLTKDILSRSAAGEPLVRVYSIPCLKPLNQATIWRWCLKGKIPALRLGRDFFTVESLVHEAIAAENASPSDVQTAGSLRHESAMASLRARGVLDAPKPRKPKSKS